MPTLFDLYGVPSLDDQAETPKPQGGEFGKGFKRAFAEVPQMAAGVGAYAADVVGADQTRDSLLGYAKQREQQNARDYGSDAASFSNVLEGKAGVGDFLANAAGYTIGQATQAIATGGLTSLGFRALAKGAALKAAQAASEKAIAAGLAEEAAKQVGIDAAQTVLRSAVIRGATAGAFGQNLGMELGSIYPDAVDQAGQDGRQLDGLDKVRVGLSSLAAAAVDTAMERVTANKIFEGTPGSSIWGRAARQVPAGMAREGVTEGIQTGIEHYGAGQPIADEKGVRDIIDSMAVGAVGGGLGGAAASLHQIEAKGQPTPDQVAADGLTKIATATNIDSAIEGFVQATSGPLTPMGISPGQEDRAMSAMELQADNDLTREKFAAQRLAAQGQPSQAALYAQRQAQFNNIGMGEPTAAPSPLTAQAVDMPFLDRIEVLRQQIADPGVRDTIRERFGQDALGMVMHYASIADRPDLHAGPEGMPEVTRERLLSLAEGIVSRAILVPLGNRGLNGPSVGIGRFPSLPAAPAAPQIGLDTAPTGTMRVDSQGNVAPETNADLINTRQPAPRPDGMTQQVNKSGLPRDFTMVGEGTLTTPQRKESPAPAAPAALDGLLLTADGFPYGTRSGAQQRANREGGGEVVEVDGGFAVRPEGVAAPAPAPAAEVPHETAPAPTPELKFPTEKLNRLIELRGPGGASREQTAATYSTIVERYGHEQAEKLLDEALANAEAQASESGVETVAAPAPAPTPATAKPVKATKPAAPKPEAKEAAPAPAEPEAALSERTDWKSATPDELGAELDKIEGAHRQLDKLQRQQPFDSPEREHTLSRMDALDRRRIELERLLPSEDDAPDAPDNWRESMFHSRTYARELGLDPAGLSLPQVVAAIDKKLGKTPEKPPAKSTEKSKAKPKAEAKPVEAKPTRDDELVTLRKRESILKSLKECLK